MRTDPLLFQTGIQRNWGATRIQRVNGGAELCRPASSAQLLVCTSSNDKKSCQLSHPPQSRAHSKSNYGLVHVQSHAFSCKLATTCSFDSDALQSSNLESHHLLWRLLAPRVHFASFNRYLLQKAHSQEPRAKMADHLKPRVRHTAQNTQYTYVGMAESWLVSCCCVVLTQPWTQIQRESTHSRCQDLPDPLSTRLVHPPVRPRRWCHCGLARWPSVETSKITVKHCCRQ